MRNGEVSFNVIFALCKTDDVKCTVLAISKEHDHLGALLKLRGPGASRFNDPIFPPGWRIKSARRGAPFIPSSTRTDVYVYIDLSSHRASTDSTVPCTIESEIETSSGRSIFLIVVAKIWNREHHDYEGSLPWFAAH